MSPDKEVFHRLAYRVLVASAPIGRWPGLASIWDRAWAAGGRRLCGSTSVMIHGRPARVNTGYAYPAFQRRWPSYNDPLVELIHQVALARGRPVNLVDVGAAVGDTVLLVLERCPGDVAVFHCVEGDDEFFGYLEHNLADIPGCKLYPAMLSDQEGEEAGLLRTHLGTASAQGSDRRHANTLDSVLGALSEVERGAIDVLKIDVDGFDGKVLAGSRQILERDRPAVIFEWHPLLCRATGQSWRLPFETLKAGGYRWFVWFAKEGEFSHVDDGYQSTSVNILADVCLTGRGPRPDWHYDVIALHESSDVSPGALASLGHAQSATTHR